MEHEKHLTVKSEEAPLTALNIKAQVKLIQEVLKAVMIEGTHYGVVPGCGDKPTLLKPGAEKLMATFRLAVNPKIEEFSTADERRYRITAEVTHQQTGIFLGAGVGEASTNEEKYKWRTAVNNKEYEEAPEDMRRKKWKKGFKTKPDYQVMQIRTHPADIANTVLKMGKKRALVDAILTVTGASDIFTQDIEDLPEEVIRKGDVTDHHPVTRASQAQEPTKAELLDMEAQRKAKAAGYAENNPETAYDGTQAPPNGKETAIGYLTKQLKPNAGGYVSFLMDGCETEKGKSMFFSTKDKDIIEKLAAKLESGEKTSFGYTTTINDKYTNYTITEVFAVQDTETVEADDTPY